MISQDFNTSFPVNYSGNHISTLGLDEPRFTISVPQNIKKVIKSYSKDERNYCIYAISRIDKEKAYVGKTANLSSRLNTWSWTFNCNFKKFQNRKIVEAIKKHPVNFEIKILSICKAEEANKEEDKYIKLFGKYNHRRGGGGGKASTTSNTQIRSAISKTKSSTTQFSTPQRKFAFRKVNGKLKIQLTPKTRKTRNVVYLIGSTYGHRLVGSTGRKISTRLNEYVHALQDPNHSKKDGIGKISGDLLRSPDKWFAAVLEETPNYKNGEINAIAEKIKNGFKVQNCNKGGAGPEPEQDYIATINPKRKIVY